MDKFYFIHIRKVAGTSVRAFLERNFAPEEVCPELSQIDLFGKMPKEDLGDYVAQFRLVSGHYYNLPKFFKEKRFTFTILRDPIARTVSEINQIRNDEKDIWYKKAKGLSPCEMLRSEEFRGPLVNSQTRYLVNNSGGRYEALNDEQRLQRAMTYLNELDFFGTTENLALVLFMLSKKAGLKTPEKVHRANTKITSSGASIKDMFDCVDDLYAVNNLDLKLYAHAKRVFEERTFEFLSEHGS